MPRHSADIDLTYLPVADRESSLEDIDASLDRIARAITARNPRVKAQRIAGGGNSATRILVNDGQAQIKIETSPVTRGAVYPARLMVPSEAERFGFAEMRVLAFEDLYAGKLHAALDRQHPRDLFDVQLLYGNEGLTDDLFRVFTVYVASSGRPMHELYAKEFLGMTWKAVATDALVGTRRRLHADIRSRLKGNIANFLLSLHDADPDFGLIGLPDAVGLSAIRWKLVNLEKLKQANPEQHMAHRDALESLFQ